MDMIFDAEARRKSSTNYGSPSSNLLKSLAEVVAEVSAEVAGTLFKKYNEINALEAEVRRRYTAIYYVYRGGTPRKCATAPADFRTRYAGAGEAQVSAVRARYLRAGYSAKTANQVGPRLLVNVGITAAISAAMKLRAHPRAREAPVNNRTFPIYWLLPACRGARQKGFRHG